MVNPNRCFIRSVDQATHKATTAATIKIGMLLTWLIAAVYPISWMIVGMKKDVAYPVFTTPMYMKIPQ
jgi:hypothetical protein